jgi:hypothetical protein
MPKWHEKKKKKRKKDSHVPCPPNKGERLIKGVFYFHHPLSIHLHNLD